MATTFNCPSCQQTIAAEVTAGSQVHCPFCNQVVTVPPIAPVGAAMTGRPGGAPAGPLKQGLAIGSLVSSCLGFFTCALGGLVGIVLGIVALVRANGEPQRYGGRGFAIAGLCVGAASLVMVPLFMAILLPSLSRARELSKRLVCTAQLQGLGVSLQIYANENNDQFPLDLETLIERGEIVTRQLCCPSSSATPDDPRGAYVYIPGLTGSDDGDLVVVYEKEENHGGEGGNVLFVDGHVEFLQPYSQVEEAVDETERYLADRQHSP